MKAFELKPIAIAACSAAIILATHAATGESSPDPSARLLRDASMMLLKEGNARYAGGKSQHPHLDAERRGATVAQGQEPFATVLACSDSREPVELIFDRGIGDIFVVRVAGNVAGTSELASMEYGVSHLNTPLLIVMGHSKCGAVTAVVKGAELHGHLESLAAKIQPAVEKVKAETPAADEAVPKAIQANVWQTIEDIIKQSSIIRDRIAAGRVQVMGALYDLEAGKVSWLGLHPAQDSLIALASQAETDAALAKKLTNAPAPLKSTAAQKPPARPAAPPLALTDDHSPSQATGGSPAGSKHH